MPLPTIIKGLAAGLKRQAIELAAGYVDGKIDTPEERKELAHKWYVEHQDEIEQGFEWLLEQAHNVADKFDGD